MIYIPDDPVIIRQMAEDNVRMRNALWRIVEELPQQDPIYKIAVEALDTIGFSTELTLEEK